MPADPSLTRFGRCRLRGAGSLAITALLLLAASIVVLYLNRNLIFEQRSAANQLRAASAHELAEAGLEWALGMLNHGHAIDAACADDPGGTTPFRARYIVFPSSGEPDRLPVTAAEAPLYPDALPACSVDATNGALHCSCPDHGAAALDLSTAAPHFTVRFEPERDHPDATDPTRFHWQTVRITAIGCVAATEVCTPPATGVAVQARQADASAVASVGVRLRPLVSGGVSAALICGGDCRLDGSYDIVNTSVADNGFLVAAGGEISSGDQVRYRTLPGLPPEHALIENDAALAAASAADPDCARSILFQRQFGIGIRQYRSAPTTRVIQCAGASDCGAQTLQAHAEGVRAFYYGNREDPTLDPDFGVTLDGSAGFPGGVLGSVDDPVLVVTRGALDLGGDIAINGIVYANRTTMHGAGALKLTGALVSCKDVASHGGGKLTHSGTVQARLQRRTSILVKVPGSWRDWSRP